ncbi:MAG: flagellar basal body-associated protein FliL, partial [Methylotenera sp.]
MAQDPKQDVEEVAPASKKKLIIIIAAVVLA